MAIHRDLLAGIIFIALGAFFALDAALHLNIGTAFRMGPGYFPVVLGSVLFVLGVAIAITGLRKEEGSMGNPIPWRAFILLTLSPIAFGVSIRTLGLIPATALCVLIGSFASTQISVVKAVVLTVLLTIFCVVLFVYVLGQPIMLIRGL